MTTAFMRKWALEAWNLESFFIGTMSGGIEGIKVLDECRVVSGSKVQILYRLPATCGLSDVRYHNPEPEKLHKDTVEFRGSKLLLNGKPFPGNFYEENPWTEGDAKEFRASYGKAFREEVEAP